MKVIITGGTGLVGQQLQKDLLAKGYQVTVLTRSAKKSNTPHLKFSPWDVQTQNIDIAELCSADHIIHLAGTNVASRKWTKTQKKSIIDSRVQTANFIFNTLKNHSHQVKTFVSASGSNAYGSLTSSHIFKETDGFGNDYLAKVCKQWETATLQFEMLNIRPVSLRTGVVFANKNSALQKMLPPIQMGIGSALGTGKQIMPFIHIKDLSKMYIHALEYPLQGAYNAISDCLSNEVLTANWKVQL